MRFLGDFMIAEELTCGRKFPGKPFHGLICDEVDRNTEGIHGVGFAMDLIKIVAHEVDTVILNIITDSRFFDSEMIRDFFGVTQEPIQVVIDSLAPNAMRNLRRWSLQSEFFLITLNEASRTVLTVSPFFSHDLAQFIGELFIEADELASIIVKRLSSDLGCGSIDRVCNSRSINVRTLFINNFVDRKSTRLN